jgi:pyruvate formate lyase activating enzyme
VAQGRNTTLEELTGLICNMQKFAIHDGPGIRTLVYMKGCPLACLWCSTPQSQRTTADILHIEVNCRRCGRCAEACPIDAIQFSAETGPDIDRVLCDACGRCVEACPGQALQYIGKEMTVGELFREVNKDSPFFRRSNGGVTVGGGEPTMQHEFVAAFLKRCKQQYIHTAIETCAYVRWEHLEKLLEHLDLVYVDIKHMDADVHQELTGVSNELILENVRRAAAMRPLTIRIPTVPGCNDSDDNVLDTATFAAELGENLQRVELLPYHQFGTQTYGRLGMDYRLTDVEPPGDEHMQRLKAIIEARGVAAQVGG